MSSFSFSSSSSRMWSKHFFFKYLHPFFLSIILLLCWPNIFLLQIYSSFSFSVLILLCTPNVFIKLTEQYQQISEYKIFALYAFGSVDDHHLDNRHNLIENVKNDYSQCTCAGRLRFLISNWNWDFWMKLKDNLPQCDGAPRPRFHLALGLPEQQPSEQPLPTRSARQRQKIQRKAAKRRQRQRAATVCDVPEASSNSLCKTKRTTKWHKRNNKHLDIRFAT